MRVVASLFLAVLALGACRDPGGGTQEPGRRHRPVRRAPRASVVVDGGVMPVHTTMHKERP